jgi:type I restriction-modification system DNA methylase subunit/restriction endonuclease S subunit
MAMSKQYSCDLCKKVFNQKIDFTRHQNKKAPCITLTEMQQISQTKEVKMDNKTTLISVFKSCLNILRDNEGLTGEKALRTLSYLLILKLLEPHFGGEINIDDYEYDFSHIEDEMTEKHKNKLLEIVRFSNLSNEKEDNIPVNMKYLWDDILSNHPTTKNIFLKGKGFDIQHKSTYKKLIDKLNSLDLSQTEYDVLGNAYEEVIQDIMTGKVLGQFFTQPLVKKMMVKLINPQIHPDGKIDTCGDPTMGTGGFLITYLQYILQQATAKNIKPDWDFIKTEGLYGKELEPDTYQLAVSNMLISSGHMFEKLDRGDSIRVPITRKFDNILANPPFGIKGLKYDDFQSPLKSEYVPIKTDNAVSLFIQAIIYMLKINGKCAVVLPDGQDLFSKTNTTLVAIREYLMKTCDLKEIIYLPSGIFTYTSIKTCVFYFVKKREGTDVLETKIKVSKTQKETGRDYKFSKTHQTTKVKFYDYNPYEDVKNLLVEVPIEKIVSNSYSLNYAEYMKDETEEEQYEEGVVVKTLGEVCKFDIGGTPSRSKNEYYENGNNLWVSVRELNGGYIYDTKEKITDLGVQNSSVKLFAKDTILFSFKLSIGKTAIVGNPLYTNEAIAGILSKNNDLLNNKYLYYYLTINDFSKLGSGILGNGSLNKKSLEQIKIPIPSLERQQEIVKYLDFIYEKANKTSNEKIAELKQLNEFCLSNQKIFGENVVKELGEISIINPENMKSGQYTEINYIDIASVKGGQILELQKLTNDFPSRAKRIVKKGDILYSSVRPNLKGYVYISDDIQNGIASTGFADIRVKEPNTILSKYLYYIMTSDYISDDLISKAKGAQYPAVSFDDFETIKIPVPSFERQKEIVEYCEYNDTLIKQLEKEIENNKKQAQQFITGIVKAQIQTEEQSDTSSVNTEPIDEVQNEIVSVEEEVIIEPKPKVKKIVKKVKKPLVIVEEDIEV